MPDMNCVTHSECENYRKDFSDKLNDTSNDVTEVKTTQDFLVKAFWVLFTAIVTGFGSTVIAILSTR